MWYCVELLSTEQITHCVLCPIQAMVLFDVYKIINNYNVITILSLKTEERV